MNIGGIRMIQQKHEREQTNESKPPAVAHSEWFNPVRNNPGWFVFTRFTPEAVCWVKPELEDIEIHNVNVIRPKRRRQGIGTEMIRHIREAFPHHHIWVDTWNHSRPFWETMVAAGYVDSIENEYSWPCSDTNCTTCHPTRVTGRRRAQ